MLADALPNGGATMPPAYSPAALANGLVAGPAASAGTTTPPVPAQPAITIPGFKGTWTRDAAAKSDPEDTSTPDAEDWDAAYKDQNLKSGAPAAKQQASAIAPVADPVTASPSRPTGNQPPAVAPVAAQQSPGSLQALANALFGGGQTVQDGRGGLVPSTNSRYDLSTGQFFPTSTGGINVSLARGLGGQTPIVVPPLALPALQALAGIEPSLALAPIVVRPAILGRGEAVLLQR
jgi:hypothetical protein